MVKKYERVIVFNILNQWEMIHPYLNPPISPNFNLDVRHMAYDKSNFYYLKSHVYHTKSNKFHESHI